MTSAPVQKFNAITNTNVPTDPRGREGSGRREGKPYLKPEIASVLRVTRPARDLKTHYNEGSKAIYQGHQPDPERSVREQRAAVDRVQAQPILR
jgi:hypothetical protein